MTASPLNPPNWANTEGAAATKANATAARKPLRIARCMFIFGMDSNVRIARVDSGDFLGAGRLGPQSRLFRLKNWPLQAHLRPPGSGRGGRNNLKLGAVVGQMVRIVGIEC